MSPIRRLTGLISVLAIALVLLDGSASARATRAPSSGADIRVLSFHADVRVAPSGAYTEREHTVIQALTRTGAQSLNPYQMEYSRSMATLEVQSAMIVTPAGQHILIPRTDIVVRPAPAPPGSDGSPIYDNNMMVSVELPGFNRGDILHLVTIKRQRKPYFKNQFFDVWGPAESESARDQRVVVQGPPGMRLFAAERGGWTLVRKVQGSAETFIATLARHHAEFPGPSTVDPSDYSPLFEVTSFPSWAAVGAAYWSGAEKQAAVTPLVRLVADRIAGKLHGWKAVQALYSWESKHIHYIGQELGVGGYVPISATTTLRTGYGDCKQHSTLLEALLAARGIRADPVLINWSNSFRLLPLPGLDFNHAIDYLPRYHVFLDTTGAYEPAGQLAIGERGKPVVIAGPHPRLARTPGAEPAENKLVYDATLHLAPDGTLTGLASMRTYGWWAWFNRSIFAELPRVAYGRLMNILLMPSGGGRGTFHPQGLLALNHPMEVRASWSTPAYALPGQTLTVPLPAGPYLVPSTSGAGNPLGALAALIGPRTRRHSVVTYIGEIDWHTTLILPPGYVPAYLPPTRRLDNRAGSFMYSVRIHRGVVRVTDRLRLDHIVYRPAEYAALRTLLLTDLSTQRAPLVFRHLLRTRS